jgi:hypothetical protein
LGDDIDMPSVFRFGMQEGGGGNIVLGTRFKNKKEAVAPFFHVVYLYFKEI